MARTTLTELKANPPKLSAAARARLAAMSETEIEIETEIEANANSDPDAPPMSDNALDRAIFARSVRRTREALGLTQADFAARYHITLSRLRDWEQGRYAPDFVAVAYMKTIRRDPEGLRAAVAAE